MTFDWQLPDQPHAQLQTISEVNIVCPSEVNVTRLGGWFLVCFCLGRVSPCVKGSRWLAGTKLDVIGAAVSEWNRADNQCNWTDRTPVCLIRQLEVLLHTHTQDTGWTIPSLSFYWTFSSNNLQIWVFAAFLSTSGSRQRVNHRASSHKLLTYLTFRNCCSCQLPDQ